MTINKSKPKRILAREILLFFCGLGLFGLIWGFLALRNTYYNHKANTLSEEIKSLESQLDNLPTDYLREFYDQTSKYFVVNYKVGTSINKNVPADVLAAFGQTPEGTYPIPKEHEKAFLTDEYGISKNVTLLPIHSNGYSYFKQYDPLNILNKDTTILFDYVLFDKFCVFIASEDYQNKLFSVFSNSPDQNGTVTVNSLIDKPKFDPMKPYNGIFNLGTLQYFKDRIKKGLTYNNKIKETKRKILDKIELTQKSITAASNNILDTKEIKKILFIILIVIGVVLYPIRLSVYSINWAVKTLKQKNI